jgi:hypothetical protein
MATIIVQAEDSGDVVLRELVHPLHFAYEHSSLQIIERIAWAVNDADGFALPEPICYRSPSSHRMGAFG